MEVNVGSERRGLAELLLEPERRKMLVAHAASRYGIVLEDAEDLLQETAFELLRRRSYVRRPEAFVTAVFKMRCVRWLEARERARAVFSDVPVGASLSSEQRSLERKIALREGFRRISTLCRRLLTDHYLEGLSLAEATSRSTALPRTVSRCLDRLRRSIA